MMVGLFMIANAILLEELRIELELNKFVKTKMLP